MPRTTFDDVNALQTTHSQLLHIYLNFYCKFYSKIAEMARISKKYLVTTSQTTPLLGLCQEKVHFGRRLCHLVPFFPTENKFLLRKIRPLCPNLKKINLLICEIGSKLDVGIYFVCSIGRPDIHLLNKTLLKSEFRQNT